MLHLEPTEIGSKVESHSFSQPLSGAGVGAGEGAGEGRADAMKPLDKVKLDTFSEVDQRRWGRVRDLRGDNHLLLRWGFDERSHFQQLFVIEMGGKEALISRQELERVLRHI